jgi:hypothetical protein
MTLAAKDAEAFEFAGGFGQVEDSQQIGCDRLPLRCSSAKPGDDFIHRR